MKSINILVIDDSDEILKTFGNKLRESGYFILKVGFSELKIMEYVKTFTPEVLLISIERKSASAAFGLIKQIRCISRIPIICVFENVDEEDIKKAVDSGRIAFGFTAQHMENVLPVWLKAIDAKNVG